MPAIAVLAAISLIGGACTGGAKTASPTASAPTAPPAQTAAAASPTAGRCGETPATPAAAIRPGLPDASVTNITDQIRLANDELPQGFSLGGFEQYQPNPAAVSGFDNPGAVLDLMNRTRRLGGLVQQLRTPDGANGGGSVHIQVWCDAQGARQYFDQYPKPEPEQGVTYEDLTLPRPVGEQSLALQYTLRGRTGYSIVWRRGRILLGVGELFPTGRESLDQALMLVDLVDKKAQAARQ